MLFFAEGKVYFIFSFLFGLGFSVQLARVEAKGADVRSFYPRRLWILPGFGLLHAAFFFVGDIPRHYVLFGFALLAFRKRTDHTLLIWAGIFVVLGFLFIQIPISVWWLSRFQFGPKVYSITEIGRKELFRWLETPQPPAETCLGWLIQVFFAGNLDDEKVIALLEHQLGIYRKRLQGFKAIPEENREEMSEDDPRDRFFWLLTIDYALATPSP